MQYSYRFSDNTKSLMGIFNHLNRFANFDRIEFVIRDIFTAWSVEQVGRTLNSQIINQSINQSTKLVNLFKSEHV